MFLQCFEKFASPQEDKGITLSTASVQTHMLHPDLQCCLARAFAQKHIAALILSMAMTTCALRIVATMLMVRRLVTVELLLALAMHWPL